jgi:hypothetical protein
MKSRILIYQQTPLYAWWFKLLLGGIMAFTLILGLSLIPRDITGAWVCLGVTLFDGLLFWVIVPRRYCIYEDRLSIKLGGPFAFDVSLASIQEAKRVSSYYAIGYWGVRFTTSTSGVVEIVRRKGINVVISLADPDAFLEELERARRSLTNAFDRK